MVHAIFCAIEMDEEFVAPPDDSGIGQTAMITRKEDSIAGRAAVVEEKSADDKVFAGDDERTAAGENDFTGSCGTESDGILWSAGASESDRLVYPRAIRKDEGISGLQ